MELSSDVYVHGRNVGVIARGTSGGREAVGLFFAIDLVVHLLLPNTAAATAASAASMYTAVYMCGVIKCNGSTAQQQSAFTLEAGPTR